MSENSKRIGKSSGWCPNLRGDLWKTNDPRSHTNEHENFVRYFVVFGSFLISDSASRTDI
jgi:hypothetical protein